MKVYIREAAILFSRMRIAIGCGLLNATFAIYNKFVVPAIQL